MKALRFHEYGGPEVLKIDDVPVPEPGTGKVLVRVSGFRHQSRRLEDPRRRRQRCVSPRASRDDGQRVLRHDREAGRWRRGFCRRRRDLRDLARGNLCGLHRGGPQGVREGSADDGSAGCGRHPARGDDRVAGPFRPGRVAERRKGAYPQRERRGRDLRRPDGEVGGRLRLRDRFLEAARHPGRTRGGSAHRL